MTRVKAVARVVDCTIVGYWVWCPGCKHAHSFPTSEKWYDDSKLYEGKRKPVWSFSGDLDCPSFTPSLRVFITDPNTKQERTLCHSVITNGQIAFYNDCEHDLKNQTVELPSIPDDYQLP